MKHTRKSHAIHNSEKESDNNPQPSLKTTDGGFCIYYGKKPLYSPVNPLKGIKRRVNANPPLKEKTLYIYPSPLLYYGTEELLEQLPENSEIWGIELDYSLYTFCREKINPGCFQDNRLKRVPWDILNNLPTLLIKENYDRFKNIEILALTGGYSLFKSRYDSLVESMRLSLKTYWKNRLTRIRLGRIWTNNIYRNLRQLKTARAINSFPVKEAVVIVGAGITVEEILPLIKKLSSRLTIIAADTVLPLLLDFGIKPDGVVNLDAQFYNLYDFYTSKDSDIPLISDLTAYPASLEITGGKNYLFYTDYGESSLLKRISNMDIPLTKVRALGSVGLTCLEIACMLSLNKPVFLAGLDFAYKLGKSHCKSSFYHTLQLQSWSRLSGEPHYSFSLERPLISLHTNAKSSEWRTDKILSEYAENMRHLISQKNNEIFSLTPLIQSLGVPYITNEDQIWEIIEKYRSNDNENIKENNFNEKSVSELIENEKNLLEKLIETWDSYIKAEVSEIELKHNLELLVDLYAHSPKEYPHPKMEPTFLVPALDMARKILHTINS